MFDLLKPSLYIQISPDRITIKDVKSGTSISDIPEIAIATGSKPTLLAVGAQAKTAAAAQAGKVINPFTHPRTLMGDFTTGQLLLKAMVQRALGKSKFSFQPTAVIHPLGSPAGGFTELENRAFLEMAMGAGASKAWVWNGRVLTDEEVRSRAFPLAEGRLGT